MKSVAAVAFLFLAARSSAPTTEPWSREAWEASVPRAEVARAYVEHYAARHGVEDRADEIMAVLWRESRFDPAARSRHSTASGIAQFLAGTWREMAARAGVVGSPMDQHAAIEVVAWAFSNGNERHWRRRS